MYMLLAKLLSSEWKTVIQCGRPSIFSALPIDNGTAR
jgi:hypothetical protein